MVWDINSQDKICDEAFPVEMIVVIGSVDADPFRAVRDGHVEGIAHPLHVGRTIIVVQTDITDANGRRVAQVTQTQAVSATT